MKKVHESVTSPHLPRRFQPKLMTFLKTILEFLDFNSRQEIYNKRFKLLPISYRTEILNMRS